MPGGLMQLVGVGAQNQLTSGNPTFSHFKSLYRKHTNFAMEHFQLPFKGIDTNLPSANQKTLRCKIDRNADMLHDCYISVNIPDIWSPLRVTGTNPTALNGNATPFLFQWIPNLGYNMIESVAVLINGSKIVEHTGEWMKMYSYTHHDANKKATVDTMVGHVPEVYDPANGSGRTGNYPNAIVKAVVFSPSGTIIPQPSIPGRQLQIPLHFWFCEDIGKAIPLIALQYSEVEIVVTFRNIYQLFTIIDVDPTSPTAGQRIAPSAGHPLQNISNFLSVPKIDGTPSNPTLTTWALNPYVEANYIFLSDGERAQMAASDHGFLIHEIRYNVKEGQTGTSYLQIPMFNLCTRIVFAYQRSDRRALNDWDNYTNWEDPTVPPFIAEGNAQIQLFSSGYKQSLARASRDVLQHAYFEFDGKERFKEKPSSFFSQLQHYRHHKGSTSKVPGLYTYSFALDHGSSQPSGSANGSMFNKTILRAQLLVPSTEVYGTSPCGVNDTSQSYTKQELCVWKSTLLQPVPTLAPAIPSEADAPFVQAIYQTVTGSPYPYTYTSIVYVESVNYLRIMSGTANVAFSS